MYKNILKEYWKVFWNSWWKEGCVLWKNTTLNNYFNCKILFSQIFFVRFSINIIYEFTTNVVLTNLCYSKVVKRIILDVITVVHILVMPLIKYYEYLMCIYKSHVRFLLYLRRGIQTISFSNSDKYAFFSFHGVAKVCFNMILKKAPSNVFFLISGDWC